MVRTYVLGRLRIRKQNAKITVPLYVVPERRTERCSPRFRPGDCFCEPRFRYLSPGREGEKCRPLLHVWQIPFIHSVRILVACNLDIYRTLCPTVELFSTPRNCGSNQNVAWNMMSVARYVTLGNFSCNLWTCVATKLRGKRKEKLPSVTQDLSSFLRLWCCFGRGWNSKICNQTG